MDVRGFFLAVRNRWLVVILATVIGAAAAVGITSREAKQYSSSVTFFVATPSAEPGQAYQANLYAQALVNSYVKLLSSEELARRVIAQAGLNATPHAVAGKISGTAGLNTVLLTASATDSTPAGAVRLSSAVAAVFGPMVSSLNNNYNTTAGKAPIVLSVVSGPTSPVKVAPRRMLNYLLGILLGLAVGLAWAALRELLDTSGRSDEQVAAVGTGRLASISRIQRPGPLPRHQALGIRAEMEGLRRRPSQRSGEAGGSLFRGSPGRAGADSTTSGQAGTARLPGSGEQGQKAQHE